MRWVDTCALPRMVFRQRLARLSSLMSTVSDNIMINFHYVHLDHVDEYHVDCDDGHGSCHQLERQSRSILTVIYFGIIFVNIDDANNIGIDNNIDIDNNIEIDNNLDNYNDIHNDNNIEIDNNIDDRSFSVQPQISAEVQLVGAPRHTETTLTCTAEVTLTIRLWWTLQWTL